MALLNADPGGEFYFSRTVSQDLAEGIFIDQNGVGVVSTAPAGRATTYGLILNGTGVYFAKGNFGNKGTLTVGWANYNSSSIFVNATEFFAFTDAATHQVELCTDATGHVFARRNGTAIGSASILAGTAKVAVNTPSGNSGSLGCTSGGTSHALVLTIT